MALRGESAPMPVLVEAHGVKMRERRVLALDLDMSELIMESHQ